MVHISELDGHYTTITVFSTTPDRQLQLYELLREGEESPVAGLLASGLHLSQDRHRVVGYAQWVSREAFVAMLTHPGGQERFRRVRSLATTVDLIGCWPVYTAQAR